MAYILNFAKFAKSKHSMQTLKNETWTKPLDMLACKKWRNDN